MPACCSLRQYLNLWPLSSGHTKLAHMGGQNYSRKIRPAIIYEFCKTVESLPDGTHGANLWESWAPIVRETQPIEPTERCASAGPAVPRL